MAKASEQPAQVSFSPQRLLKLYQEGSHDQLSVELLAVLDFYGRNTMTEVRPYDLRAIRFFLKTFLYIFSQPDFNVPAPRALAFIRHNRVISNLVALAGLQTTDFFLEMVLHEKDSLGKVLTLYSARNQIRLDRKQFFEANAELASAWYIAYGNLYRTGVVNREILERLQDHFQFRHPALALDREDITVCYFGSTYVDGKTDRAIKLTVNKQIQQSLSRIGQVWNKPNPRKIAVASGCWYPAHSVYRICSAHVKALHEHYHLTLLSLEGMATPPDVELFDEVRELPFRASVLDLRPVAQNDFQVLYLPDVGMSPQSILLANCRIAPIQICSLGHSCSTWGAAIDYYISGADVELPVKPERNYSERLVLLPGMGAIHNVPLYQPRGLTNSTDRVRINCSWHTHKINHRFVSVLQQILKGARTQVCLRVFTGGSSLRDNSYLPFAADLTALLGKDNLEIFTQLSYSDYMAEMETGDLALDSFHFGGCNTIADSLLLRIPVLTWEGDKWYNRIGPQMLRVAGIPELIASSRAEFVEQAVRLINDREYRLSLRERLTQVDLNQTVFSEADAHYFRKAVDYLLERHESLQATALRSPIRIERDT